MSADGPAGPESPSDALDPEALFHSLAEAGIDYVLIGGLAVAAHGAIRATADLDICPAPTEDNLRRLAGLLNDLGAVSVDQGEFETEELPSHDLAGLRGGGNYRLRTRLGNLDIMQFVNPFGDRTWETLSRHAEERQVFGHTIRVCSYDDLLRMKQAAGRDQDLIDIRSMKAARREL